MATVISRRIQQGKDETVVTPDIVAGNLSDSKESVPTISAVGLNLGAPADEKKFWWQRRRDYNPDAIATLPSVFDDPETAKTLSASWTWREEYAVLRKVDVRIMIFACVMFMALELDGANLTQAVTDNFLGDLEMNTNDYNWGNTVFKLSFLCAELPSQLVSKWMGPRSLDSYTNGSLVYRRSFTVLAMILYLSYFYKHGELSLRLGFWWTAMSIADIVASFLGFGLLHLRGHLGYAGWRWLFLVEDTVLTPSWGLFTLIPCLVTFILMPPRPCQTANWARGKKGWFTEREETIMVNRIIREDPSKISMHNRQPITPKLLWQSLSDYDLWPLYLLGLNFQTPMTTPTQYLTLSLKQLGFDTFKTNLLVIPSQVGHIITMLLFTYLAEVVGQLWLFGLLAQLWALPFLAYIYAIDINSIDKWVAFGVMTVPLSYPSVHAIQVGWNSRNSNSVRSRTVSAALYNMACRSSGIIASNIYREDDRPRYRRGNRALVSICAMNVGLYIFAKAYYALRNRYRDKVWNSMTEDQRAEYLATTTDKGNKRLDFRFAS
ncbi:uncharacterized protein Z518_05114 [Rhinocladiella mackenziei CBS 650.93]|uniref:Major facilitator superfamily (MFS) profile domain-containing protein n=1 Tax=Rhinocladiella mackenziei CBS 650.93 TaxID=1442369 RepID=A0A0D2FXW7_9EURO|nr:uncharacterized protein Z518_05114 [Rhinocladiella mackenziei CBS 650.93]KIX07137.1 hypothetical protein Z518_05114 [Rhinocladiella mackenziei CBS 650.93]